MKRLFSHKVFTPCLLLTGVIFGSTLFATTPDTTDIETTYTHSTNDSMNRTAIESTPVDSTNPEDLPSSENSETGDDTIDIELNFDFPSTEEATPESTPETPVAEKKPPTEDELKEMFHQRLVEIINERYDAILNQNDEQLKSLYDTSIKTGLYAYESEAIKMRYLANWAEKQGVQFIDIEPLVHMRKVKDREAGKFGMTCNVCTTFTYVYDSDPESPTQFKLGTSHYIHLQEQSDGTFKVVKEWYTDPFADSLEISDLKSEDMKKFISTHTYPSFTIDERTQKAIDYAHTYCGIGEGEHMFKYNPNYINCNPRGGDCANFASQILHEGGGFKKNKTWNYNGDGTKAWLNAQGFTQYMVNSGRASYITKGSYEKIYKDAYVMRPGDFVAYEKKGRITHVSTVTGLDSKGYPLVTCHNTDRLLVPYDLGWSNKNITYHLINVHY